MILYVQQAHSQAHSYKHAGWSRETMTKSQNVCTLAWFIFKKRKEIKSWIYARWFKERKMPQVYKPRYMESVFVCCAVCKSDLDETRCWLCLMSLLIKLLRQWCAFMWSPYTIKNRWIMTALTAMHYIEPGVSDMPGERRGWEGCEPRRNELSKRISECKALSWPDGKRREKKSLQPGDTAGGD